jgi:hypothetical protein
MKKMLNGELVDLTPEEINQIEVDKVKSEEDKAGRQSAKEAHETLVASAKAKLIAGEALTEEEADTIVL